METPIRRLSSQWLQTFRLAEEWVVGHAAVLDRVGQVSAQVVQVDLVREDLAQADPAADLVVQVAQVASEILIRRLDLKSEMRTTMESSLATKFLNE